jgi:hypothetical protein
MKRFFVLALPVLFAATPALATGGFDCRTTDRSNIRVSGTIGHGIVNPLVGARLVAGERIFSTEGQHPEIAIGQSWIDSREIRVDLVDPQASRFEVQLRLLTRPAWVATGTLVRAGRTHRVRCTLE